MTAESLRAKPGESLLAARLREYAGRTTGYIYADEVNDLNEAATKLDCYEVLRAAVEHVICDSPGTPETVKGWLRKALRGEQ